MGRTSKGKIEICERRSQGLQLRLEGCSIREIARKLGCAPSTAYADLTASLQELNEMHQQRTEEYLTLELSRLDALSYAVASRAFSGDLKAIDAMLSIMDRRAKLLGLYRSPQPQLDVLTALKVLAENNMLPDQVLNIASVKLNEFTATIGLAIASNNHANSEVESKNSLCSATIE